MSLRVVKNDRLLTVSVSGETVAEVHLDYRNRTQEIILYATTPDEVQMQVLQHFATPLLHRSIAKFDRKELVNELSHLQVGVTVAAHKTVPKAVQHAINQIGIPNLRYQLLAQALGNEQVLRFTVTQPDRFTFWYHLSVPGKDEDGNYDIVPFYHPVMSGAKEVGMINGYTDAYISGKTVRSVYCPRVSQSIRTQQQQCFGSWNHVKHPFCAVGRSLTIAVNSLHMRSKEGVQELINFLQATLSRHNKYVGISGGFYPPMKSAHNLLLEKELRSPWPGADYTRGGHLARGSEAHCVWAYRTLQTEGFLKQSYVPSWFLNEGWLTIYEGAEVRPGLY